jgi:hypothetical protein
MMVLQVKRRRGPFKAAAVIFSVQPLATRATLRTGARVQH